MHPRAQINPSDDHASADPEHRAPMLLLFAVSLAFGSILLPLFGTILWGSIIALLFAPLYRWLLPRLKRRRTPAELLTLLVAPMATTWFAHCVTRSVWPPCKSGNCSPSSAPSSGPR